LGGRTGGTNYTLYVCNSGKWDPILH
jgi:hypothetical protein